MLTPSKSIELSLDSDQLSCDRRILLFDLSIGGHHPSYILHLIRYWSEQELPGYLDIVVLPKFIERHNDVVDVTKEYGHNRVNFVAITAEEEAALSARSNPVLRALRAFQEWDLLCKYTNLLKATQCLLLYFDTSQLPIILGRRPHCPVSGIYFRPTFHYSDFKDYRLSWKDQLQKWREKLLLSQILRYSQLQTLFCLDPFVVKHFDRFNSKVRAVHLPDPVYIYGNSELEPEKLREDLGIPSNRKIFLLFGALDQRKGLHKLLEAISLLSPELCQNLCLVLVGSITCEDKLPAQNRINQLTQSLPVQIIANDQFVSDPIIEVYFQLADVILAPYQRHVGMSGILVRAAAAQKPVLSSDYGLMGELTRRYQLGLTVDSTKPSEIAKGLTQFLQQSPLEFCDRTKMKQLAEQSSAEEFARVIFQNL